MANAISRWRTNYFAVVDEDKFRKLINACQAEDKIQIASKETPGEGVKFALLCEDELDGLPIPDDSCGHGGPSCAGCPEFESGDCEGEDHECDAFFREMQALIAPGDAMVITTMDNEKLCYLYAYATVVTSAGIETVNLNDEAVAKAREMLGDPGWDSCFEY